MDETEANEINDLVIAARRHPNSKVAKLINEYLNDNSHTTLVLLLEELEKSEEYAVDFTISISFFLKRIEQGLESNNCQFSNLGRKLMAAARIWGKRVEDLYSRAECQASNSEKRAAAETETETPNEAPAAAKPKSRKRPIQDDSNELKMEVKSFKRATANKLFADCEDKDNPQMLPYYFTEEHINPALYKSSFIIDPDNVENIERKNNYKIFHYHIEHRYNTPVSDYNFRLHFAVKDYMHNNENIDDANNEVDELVATDDEHCLPSWAPQQYLEKAIGLENQAFEGQLSMAGYPRKRKSLTELDDPVEKQPRFSVDISNTQPDDPKTLKSLPSQDSGIGDNSHPLTEGIRPVEEVPNQNETIGNGDLSFNPEYQAANSSEIANFSLINNTESNAANIIEGINNSTLPDFNQSSLLESTKLNEVHDAGNPNTDLGFAETDKVLPDVVLTTDKLSQSDDEGIVLSDQEESFRQTPTENIEQENVHQNINDDNVEASNNNNNVDTTRGPVENNLNQVNSHNLEEYLNITYPININIFGFNENILKRKTNFKLPLELNCLHQERLLKSKAVKKTNETKKQQIESAKATSQLNKYNRMGGPDSIFPLAQRSESSMNDEGNESENDEDFIGFMDTSTTRWSSGKLVFPKNGFNEIPQVRDASDDNAHIINDQSFIERGCEAAEQSVLDTEQCMPNATNNQELTDEIIENLANINIGSPVNEHEVVNPFDVLEINLNDTSVMDDDEMNIDGPFEPSFMDSEGDDEDLEKAESEQRIRDWHRKIGPALAEAHQRQQFSVFDIGTNIINKVSQGADTMEKLTVDEDPYDLSKNFLSLLILTNQGNVELDCGERNYNEPTDLSKLKVNLLSTKRHEVHIEDDIGASSLVKSPPKKKAKELTTKAATPSTSRVTATKTTNIKVSEVQKMVRTLKPIPKAKNTDDNDSGVGSFISQDSIS